MTYIIYFHLALCQSVEIGYEEIGDIYLATTGDDEGVEDRFAPSAFHAFKGLVFSITPRDWNCCGDQIHPNPF